MKRSFALLGEPDLKKSFADKEHLEVKRSMAALYGRSMAAKGEANLNATAEQSALIENPSPDLGLVAEGELGEDAGVMSVERPKKKGWFMKRLLNRYDNSFLFALGMQYFNTGLRQIIMLADNNFWDTVYGLPPGTATMYSSWINLPWSPKLLYGIVTDSIPIFGSTKRSYVVLMGIIQFITLMIVALKPGLDPAAIMGLTVAYSTGGAFMEVVC